MVRGMRNKEAESKQVSSLICIRDYLTDPLFSMHCVSITARCCLEAPQSHSITAFLRKLARCELFLEAMFRRLFNRAVAITTSVVCKASVHRSLCGGEGCNNGCIINGGGRGWLKVPHITFI